LVLDCPKARADLGNFIQELYHHIFRDLLAENKIGDYIEALNIHPEFSEYLYPALDCFSPETIRTFNYNKSWLETKIIKYSKGRFGLAPLEIPESCLLLPCAKVKTKTDIIEDHTPVVALALGQSRTKVSKDWEKFLLNNRDIYLDTETFSIGDKNPMNDMGLRTIQLGNKEGELHYIFWETLSNEDKDKIRKLLQDKKIYLFNLNFDISQLKHAGLKVESNRWYDIALLARLTDNDKLDKEVMHLST